MKKPELDSLLKKARLPEIPEESLEMFPRRIVADIKRRDYPLRPRRHLFPQWAWACGMIACIAIAFGAGHWLGQTKTTAPMANDSLANIKLIHETLALFPNRVRAIVQDERGIRLVLSDQETVPVSTPIYVRISDGRHCSSLVTFSGQEIQIAGQKLTVLSQSDGGIILEGNQFVWSSSGPVYAGRKLKIEAKNLGIAAM
jgi:hypothetical protein